MAEGPGAHRGLAAFALPFIVATALASGAVGAITGTAAIASSSVATASASPSQLRQFWTPARMKRAKPMEVQVSSGGLLPFARPGGGGETSHLISEMASSAGAEVSSTFDVVADPTATEASRNGVIFFEDRGGLARCSGTSVNARNFSVVFTAAHCIHSGSRWGRWYRGRWVFVPGYRYGQLPFGVFPAKWLDTTQLWRRTGSENGDVGAAVVMRNERGERLADAVGGAGIAWGLKADQVFDVHGYPAGPPFDGETQRLCAGTPFLGHDVSSFIWDGPLNLAVDCNVTGGASGGGWTIRGGVLNSVTNYGHPEDQATDFGAYFGKEVARLYGRAARVR
ncbi:MAG TPA: hypothetical protein VFI03_10545 [Solirubrobacterales bacterium]|nr:hypothetical protein [Solirubrobacterales bacterium]